MRERGFFVIILTAIHPAIKNEGGTYMSTPLTINSVETLQEALPIIRASQEAYSTFTQEQVDAICEKTAMAVFSQMASTCS